MAVLRTMSYRDYGIDEEKVKRLLEYCRSDEADIDLIKKSAELSNASIKVYLIKSVVGGKSYDVISDYVPMTKGDFYAYRRKMIAKLIGLLDEKNIEY